MLYNSAKGFACAAVTRPRAIFSAAMRRKSPMACHYRDQRRQEWEQREAPLPRRWAIGGL